MTHMTIAKVVNSLTERQKKDLAKQRSQTTKGDVTPRGLANSYKGDWVALLKDMTNDQLARALKELVSEDELRVIALRAFDGREVDLSTTSQEAKGIIEKLCGKGRAPKKLYKETWNTQYAKMLQDIGWESERIPKGIDDKVKLRRIFKPVH